MSDLISRKALLEELKNTYVPVSVKLIDIITNAPAVEQGEPVTFGGIVRTYKASPPQPQEQDKPVKKAVKDALEKAAKICEKMQKDENNTHIGERCSYGTCQIQGSTFAKAIRALIEKE